MQDNVLLPPQMPEQLVQVADWATGEDPQVFPVGSKPKKLLICPDSVQLPFLIPGHRYLFKTTPDWREQQLWSEIVAYEIARLCGVHVPPCFAAFNGQSEESGVLMEFFYGYPDESHQVRFITGSDILQRSDPEYNPKTGRPHDFFGNVLACRAFGVPSPLTWWTKTLVFDALIGNTDRHAENWGLLRGGPDMRGRPQWTMAPAFDHGTSLGYEVREADIGRRFDAAAIERHLQKGRHHCTWEPRTEKHGDPFFALCAQLVDSYPRMRDVAVRVIPTADAPINEIVSRFVEFDLPVKFSAARAEYVERLFRARRTALVHALGI
jgi:hypothetical protein